MAPSRPEPRRLGRATQRSHRGRVQNPQTHPPLAALGPSALESSVFTFEKIVPKTPAHQTAQKAETPMAPTSPPSNAAAAPAATPSPGTGRLAQEQVKANKNKNVLTEQDALDAALRASKKEREFEEAKEDYYEKTREAQDEAEDWKAKYDKLVNEKTAQTKGALNLHTENKSLGEQLNDVKSQLEQKKKEVTAANHARIGKERRVKDLEEQLAHVSLDLEKEMERHQKTKNRYIELESVNEGINAEIDEAEECIDRLKREKRKQANAQETLKKAQHDLEVHLQQSGKGLSFEDVIKLAIEQSSPQMRRADSQLSLDSQEAGPPAGSRPRVRNRQVSIHDELQHANVSGDESMDDAEFENIDPTLTKLDQQEAAGVEIPSQQQSSAGELPTVSTSDRKDSAAVEKNPLEDKLYHAQEEIKALRSEGTKVMESLSQAQEEIVELRIEGARLVESLEAEKNGTSELQVKVKRYRKEVDDLEKAVVENDEVIEKNKEELAEVKSLRDQVARQEKQLKQKDQALRESQEKPPKKGAANQSTQKDLATIQSLRDQVAQQEKQLKQQAQTLRDQQEELAKRLKTVEDSQKELATVQSLRKQVAQQEKQLKQQDQTSRDQQEEMAKKLKATEDSQKELATIQSLRDQTQRLEEELQQKNESLRKQQEVLAKNSTTTKNVQKELATLRPLRDQVNQLQEQLKQMDQALHKQIDDHKKEMKDEDELIKALEATEREAQEVITALDLKVSQKQEALEDEKAAREELREQNDRILKELRKKDEQLKDAERSIISRRSAALELEAEAKRIARVKANNEKLKMSAITSVDTSPVAPPPPPVTVIEKIKKVEVSNGRVPWWVHVLGLLMVLLCAAISIAAIRERNTWLAANDQTHLYLLQLTAGHGSHSWLETLIPGVEEWIGVDNTMLG